VFLHHWLGDRKVIWLVKKLLQHSSKVLFYRLSLAGSNSGKIGRLNNKCECTVDQELAHAAALALHVHSTGGSTFLCE